MQAGDYDQLIAVERSSSSADGVGGSLTVWAPLQEYWARIVPETGKERIISGRADTAPSYRVFLRMPADVTAFDRISWRGDQYDIDDLVPPTSRAPEMDFVISRHSP